jgi:hypothetical protein
MLERNLFDEAARVLAMPIPRRKAFKHLAAGFAGALLSLAWPKQARAAGRLPLCGRCPGCSSDFSCSGKYATSRCGTNRYCRAGTQCRQGLNKYACCRCVAGTAPAAPDIATIPDVALTREASLAARNCQEGTEWVASWFPGRHSVSAREAAAEAIARGEPWLAREIARTAHLVQRSAQV